MSSENSNNLKLEFTGKGQEYFGIWIVNILLTIITLGLYLPWAKVRNRKYFYNNTRLDGAVFDYHANPVSILKGWLIVVVLMIGYNIVSSINPFYGMIYFFVLMIMAPWAIVRSRIFNLRNTSYRNVRFYFNRDYKEIYKIFILAPTPYVLGMILMIYATQQMQMGNSAGGTMAIAGILMFSSVVLFPYFVARFYRFLVCGSILGKENFQCKVGAKDFYVIYFLAFILSIVVFGVLFAVIRGSMTEGGQLSGLGTFFIFVVYVGGIFLIGSLVTVMTLNEVWNSTDIAGNRFVSKLEIMPYFWILLSNTILAALTLGLYTPWAKVRIANYRMNQLSVDAADNIDSFMEQRREEVGAFGEELGDALDMEFGL